MKRLFDEEDDWNEDAWKLCEQVENLIKPLFEEWANNGFSLIDAASIAWHTISIAEMELTLKHQFRRMRERRGATDKEAAE